MEQEDGDDLPVAAGAVPDVSVLAVAAPFDDTAQRGSAAFSDGSHQALLIEGDDLKAVIPQSRDYCQSVQR